MTPWSQLSGPQLMLGALHRFRPQHKRARPKAGFALARTLTFALRIDAV